MIPQEAAKSFSLFFEEKIETIRQELNEDPLDTAENFASSVHSSDLLSSFYALSEILKLVRESKSTTATVDPAPNNSLLNSMTFFCLCFKNSQSESHIWHCASCVKKRSSGLKIIKKKKKKKNWPRGPR